MHVVHRSIPLGVALALLTSCGEVPPPTGAPTAVARSASIITTATGEEVELKRGRIDVTDWIDETVTVPPDVPLPEAPEGIGPGSPLIILIPGEHVLGDSLGRFGCTANFVWRQGGKLYLGAAGHCFLPASRKSTHGAGADYDASGVVVQVCVKNCEGNFRTSRLVGTLVTLGKVAYARQTDPTATEDVGNDFGVVEIPASAAHLVRPGMQVWGGPDGVQELKQGEFACHYGNGTGFGEVFLTKARVGVGGGGDENLWVGDFAGSPGDSGSGLNACVQDGLTFRGTAAVGVLTHLVIGWVCPCDVNFKKFKVKAEHGFVAGTTVRRAVEMATEAGLKLSIVEP